MLVNKLTSGPNMPVQFYLFTRPDKQGDHPINVSISLFGERLCTSVGYAIAPDKWDDKTQRVKKNAYNSKKVAYNLINSRLNLIHGHFERLEAIEKKLTKDEIRSELATLIKRKEKVSKTGKNAGLFDHYDEFVKDGITNKRWAQNTSKKWTTVRHHLKEFNEDLKYEDITDKTLSAYVLYCARDLGMLDSSIQKELSLLRWFLRWAEQKGYHNNNAYEKFRARFKESKRPIIFLNKDEVMKVLRFQIPENGTEVTLHDINGNEYKRIVSERKSLEKVRDLLCFCCFTSLRYSDMDALKRTDIVGGKIYVTTMKTDDSLVIEVNKFAAEILDKYKDCDFGEYALPRISNQKMNHHLKMLCELCEFNEPITIIQYLNGTRHEFTYPKWQVVSTHTGRKSFICNALAAGIPVHVVMKWTGHSDYKAMKPYIEVAEKTKAAAMDQFTNMFE